MSGDHAVEKLPSQVFGAKEECSRKRRPPLCAETLWPEEARVPGASKHHPNNEM